MNNENRTTRAHILYPEFLHVGKRTAARVMTLLASVLASAGVTAPARAGTGALPDMNMPGMNMPGMKAEGPGAASRQAFTTNHRYLIRLLVVPQPVPFEKYFTLQLAVYDGKDPSQRIANASLDVSAGMRHGLKHGFAHGMQSTPVIEAQHGSFLVRGMYFHMMGPWVLMVRVRQGARSGTAYLPLVCCG
jgi:hypothetical protein